MKINDDYKEVSSASEKLAMMEKLVPIMYKIISGEVNNFIVLALDGKEMCNVVHLSDDVDQLLLFYYALMQGAADPLRERLTAKLAGVIMDAAKEGGDHE